MSEIVISLSEPVYLLVPSIVKAFEPLRMTDLYEWGHSVCSWSDTIWVRNQTKYK